MSVLECIFSFAFSEVQRSFILFPTSQVQLNSATIPPEFRDEINTLSAASAALLQQSNERQAAGRPDLAQVIAASNALLSSVA